jgi:hypothetical protein
MADCRAGYFSENPEPAGGLPVDYRFAKMACEMEAKEEHRDVLRGRACESESGKLRHLKCISKLGTSPLVCSGSGKMEGGRAAERVFSRLRIGKDLIGLECGCGERARGEHAGTVKHILFECSALEECRAAFKVNAERRWKEEVAEMAKRQPDRTVVNPWGKTSILQRAPGEALQYLQQCLWTGRLTAGDTRKTLIEVARRQQTGDETSGSAPVDGFGEAADVGVLQMMVTDEMLEEALGEEDAVRRVKGVLGEMEESGQIQVRGMSRI